MMGCIYDMYTILLSVMHYDKVLILGCSGGLILPVLFPFRRKFVYNMGGIEWARDKWSPTVKQIMRALMWISAKSCKYLIADNQGMKEYIEKTYKRYDSVVIAYGGDQAKKMPIASDLEKQYPFLMLNYAIAIARIQPDNNTELLLEAFKDAPYPLVYIGNWSISEYAIRIKQKYNDYTNLILLDAIYDLDVLNVLRSNCYVYIHGHSAGGTNPSLVEAMNLPVPLVCFDNVFNRYVTENDAFYFSNVTELVALTSLLTDDMLIENEYKMKQIAMGKYTWKKIAHEYYSYIKQ
jgi:glycosyltransferase involved in cell wall biosynthesis